VVGDSLLKGAEAPICQPDKEAREVCCLLGAQVQTVAKRVPLLVKSTDYYPLLLLHVGTNDSTSQKLGRIKKDFKGLGVDSKIRKHWCPSYLFVHFTGWRKGISQKQTRYEYQLLASWLVPIVRVLPL